MVCPTCGMENYPSAVACARCNTTLREGPPPQYATPVYPRRPVPLIPLLSGIAIVASLIVIGVVVYRDRTAPTATAPPPAIAATQPATATTEPPAPEAPEPQLVPDARAQAAVIDALLADSGASRDKLNGAIDRVGRCAGPGGALGDLRAVGDERRAQIAAVREADLSGLADGERLRSMLVTALEFSLDADEAYVDWAAEAVSNGCVPSGTRQAAFNRGRAASDDAGAAKETFLAAWNPVATQLGFRARTRQGI